MPVQPAASAPTRPRRSFTNTAATAYSSSRPNATWDRAWARTTTGSARSIAAALYRSNSCSAEVAGREAPTADGAPTRSSPVTPSNSRWTASTSIRLVSTTIQGGRSSGSAAAPPCRAPAPPSSPPAGIRGPSEPERRGAGLVADAVLGVVVVAKQLEVDPDLLAVLGLGAPALRPVGQDLLAPGGGRLLDQLAAPL